jgi:hypothetical protein
MAARRRDCSNSHVLITGRLRREGFEHRSSAENASARVESTLITPPRTAPLGERTASWSECSSRARSGVAGDIANAQRLAVARDPAGDSFADPEPEFFRLRRQTSRRMISRKRVFGLMRMTERLKRA